MSAIRIFLSYVILFVVGSASMVSAFTQGDSASGGWIFLVFIVSFFLFPALIIIISIIYFRRFLWEITDTDIHIYSGIIFKKQVHIPFTKVQSIDFNAGVMERILGLVRLKIETAGGAANRGVIIPALKLKEAEALRADVFLRKQRSAQQQEIALRQKMQTAKAARVAQEGQIATGAPDATGAPGAPDVSVARFDPQTGQPLPAPLPAPASTTLGGFVRGVGDEVAGLRGIFAENYQENAPIEYEYGLTAKELLLSAISGDHYFVTLFVLLGAASQLGGLISVFDFNNAVEWLTRSAFNKYALPIIITTIVSIFLFLLLLGIINTAISYGGFKARRRGGRIEVERGLLSRQYRSVAISRIQAIEIRQSFIRRLIGYAELKLLTVDSISTDSNQQNNQALQTSGLVVHPFVKMNRIAGILEGLTPEFNNRPAATEVQSLPGVALRRSINRRAVIPGLFYVAAALGVTVLASLAPFLSPRVAWTVPIALWILVLILVVLQLVGGILWYRHAGYACNAGMLLIRQGGYSQVTTIVPRHKIQWAATRQNPFQRLSGLATLIATTAAGVKGTAVSLRDLRLEDAYACLDWIRPRRHGSQGSTD
jgi:putative membrane protein